MTSSIYHFMSQFPALVQVKKQLDLLDLKIFSFRRRLRRFLRSKSNMRISESRLFGILCVKRVEYVQLAIANINSLHFVNPLHIVYLYCDAPSKLEFSGKRHLLDYPDRVFVVPLRNKANQPWQYYKIEALIDITKKGGSLTDADERWFSDPFIPSRGITFLTPAYKFSREKNELLLFEGAKIDISPEWIHYATGFVHISPELLTPELTRKLWATYKIIRMNGGERLSDELAINVVLQACYKREYFSVLKAIDGPGNRKVVQSFYFGLQNGIVE